MHTHTHTQWGHIQKWSPKLQTVAISTRRGTNTGLLLWINIWSYKRKLTFFLRLSNGNTQVFKNCSLHLKSETYDNIYNSRDSIGRLCFRHFRTPRTQCHMDTGPEAKGPVLLPTLSDHVSMWLGIWGLAVPLLVAALKNKGLSGRKGRAEERSAKLDSLPSCTTVALPHLLCHLPTIVRAAPAL